jgi:hypothetical protein
MRHPRHNAPHRHSGYRYTVTIRHHPHRKTLVRHRPRPRHLH